MVMADIFFAIRFDCRLTLVIGLILLRFGFYEAIALLSSLAFGMRFGLAIAQL